MTLDLDELEENARAAAEWVNDPHAWNNGRLAPDVVLALIERVRLAENVGSEWMALQEAAGFPSDGMSRGVKDVSDAVVLMAERVKELERDRHTVAHELGCADDACAYAVQAATQRVQELERYKAAALKTMDALTREYEALEQCVRAMKDAIRLNADAFDESDLRRLGVTEDA